MSLGSSFSPTCFDDRVNKVHRGGNKPNHPWYIRVEVIAIEHISNWSTMICFPSHYGWKWKVRAGNMRAPWFSFPRSVHVTCRNIYIILQQVHDIHNMDGNIKNQNKVLNPPQNRKKKVLNPAGRQCDWPWRRHHCTKHCVPWSIMQNFNRRQ